MLSSIGTIRRIRIICISIVVLARVIFKDIIRYNYYTVFDSVASDNNKSLDLYINNDDDTDTPEASLPGHHTPLPQNSSTWFDAIDVKGNRGYIADPTLFRKLVLQWHQKNENATTYWDRLQQYQSHLMLKKYDNNTFDMNYICSLTESNGGGGELNDGGVKIITDYVKVDYKSPVLRRGCTESPPLKHERPKLFCGIYTHNAQRDFTRISALSHGWKCDGFLAFSSVTIPSLGMVGLLHKGDESYHNMVQKSRSIWSYIATHYIDQFDYFHLGGDDMHVIVENMRSLLLERETESTNGKGKGRIFGQLASKGVNNLFIRGGAGYTIDREGLKKLHEYMPKCARDTIGFWEDNAISNCGHKLNLKFDDNRDSCTGQQRSHQISPGMIFRSKGQSESDVDKNIRFFASQSHPMQPDAKVGMKVGLDAASNHSVTFHKLRYQSWMVRHHALLYRACPLNSMLGKFYQNQKAGIEGRA